MLRKQGVSLPRRATEIIGLTRFKIKLFVSSEVPIYQIFADDPSNKSQGMSDHMRSVMDDLVCSANPV